MTLWRWPEGPVRDASNTHDKIRGGDKDTEKHHQDGDRYEPLRGLLIGPGDDRGDHTDRRSDEGGRASEPVHARSLRIWLTLYRLAAKVP